jgi:hypothetical protein
MIVSRVQKYLLVDFPKLERVCQNCGQCKFCNKVQESTTHILFKCRFIIRVYFALKNWLGLHYVEPKSGGSMKFRSEANQERPWHLSQCWFHEKFGKREMLVFFETKQLP